MRRALAWTKTLFCCMRHTEGWRLAWAAALALLLWGWALLQNLEGQTSSTTLTLLFEPGFEEADIRAFAKTLPQAHASTLRTPAQLQADAQRFWEKLGLPPEGGAGLWEGEEGEARPPESKATGWAVELHWKGLSPALTKQAKERVAALPSIEEAYWGLPSPPWALAALRHTTHVLFALSTGAALLALSLLCLRAEAKHLKVLLALGASLAKARALWLAQGIVWALLSALCAYCVGKAALEALGFAHMEAGWKGFAALGAAYGGAGAYLSWALRGKTWCT